jgi:hypothetical protein
MSLLDSLARLNTQRYAASRASPGGLLDDTKFRTDRETDQKWIDAINNPEIRDTATHAFLSDLNNITTLRGFDGNPYNKAKAYRDLFKGRVFQDNMREIEYYINTNDAAVQSEYKTIRGNAKDFGSAGKWIWGALFLLVIFILYVYSKSPTTPPPVVEQPFYSMDPQSYHHSNTLNHYI